MQRTDVFGETGGHCRMYDIYRSTAEFSCLWPKIKVGARDIHVSFTDCFKRQRRLIRPASTIRTQSFDFI